MTVIAVDVETTGLDGRTSSIVSIGAVAIGYGSEFYAESRPWDGASVYDEALKVNGTHTTH